ncbi:Isochorismatase hydrolase [Eremomyces bilateralis CBS 781.70]|uniref:Isochorismatase hydrolase n=1 Tax=Eremomyces bilateralis CBS 781.70 TaxID=1392243 RepID=A0A6G1FWT3_9PEZI|nr:Isochorismatase hydrolase [Eremomyces bilateralis CBS 781.70]KAF1810089.1 Isochorismatase hydrolase [Eremomyces bilateralis CBS 781.70]
MPRTALFVIDIQHELAGDPTTQIPHASRIIDAASNITLATRAAIDEQSWEGVEPDCLIVVVQHEEAPEGGTLLRGSKAWELVFPPRCGDLNEMLVAKRTGDTFESNPKLAAELKTKGVTEIIAFGLQSEFCVRSTCRGALAAGSKVKLLSGAHSTYDVKEKTAVEIEREIELELKGEEVVVLDWEEYVDGFKDK